MATKTLVMYLGGQKEKRVEVPADARITFGPAIPFERKGGGYARESEYAVRVYEGATEKSPLLAVFTGVREFRLDSLVVRELLVRESGTEVWKSDDRGVEMNRQVKREKYLKNPDEDLLALPVAVTVV